MSSSIIPTLRYRDARKMIDWLCAALGLHRHAVYDDDRGGIAHAQLSLGDGMIMLGSARDDEFGRLQRTATDLGGNSQGLYVVVDDIDAIYSRVKSHGGKILLDLEAKEYGGKGFTFRDPEDQLWSVGAYDPWKSQA